MGGMKNEATRQSNALRVFNKKAMKNVKTPRKHNGIEPRSGRAAKPSKMERAPLRGKTHPCPSVTSVTSVVNEARFVAVGANHADSSPVGL